MNLKITLLLLMLTFWSQAQVIDIQGHRGARGMMPENSIPAFIYALDQGVTTLELDVVITKDLQVVVSHEPWISHIFCYDQMGNEISKKAEKTFNIFELTYEELLEFDCGSKGNNRFPDQVKMKVNKPLLIDAIKTAERHMKGVTLREANYNIEIKSTPDGDGKFHPNIEKFSDLVYSVVNEYLPLERVYIQSFDFRVLQYWHSNYPDVQLVALIENLKSVNVNIEELGFVPNVYSPYYKLLTKKKVEDIHAKGMVVIPWTVNKKEDMLNLVKMGVDGIITDFPNVAVDILELKE